MSQLGTLDKKSTWIAQSQVSTVQNPPTSAQLYTILAQTNRATRIISVFAQVTWTVQPTPLEILITVDGVLYDFIQANPGSVTSYYVTFKASTADNNQSFVTTDPDTGNPPSFFLEGMNILIQVRVTGGTVQNLTAACRYAIQ